MSIAPQGNFCQERQKSPKTPFETHGFKTSFTRLNPSNVGSAYIANRNAVTSGWKCCTAATSLFAAAPLKNVGAGNSTVVPCERLSGLEGSQCNILPCLTPQLLQDKGGQGTIGPLRRFFGNFLSLVKESYSSKTGQGSSLAGAA